MKIEIKAASDTGCVKSNNEDLLLADRSLLREGTLTAEAECGTWTLFAVADGVGGAEGGEIASEMVLTSLLDFFSGIETDASASEMTEKIRSWAVGTNRLVTIRAGILDNPGMGTTLTGMALSGDNALLFNAGDSRVYRFRDGILRQLTVDHSMRELTNNPDMPGNLMYNAFGSMNEFFIDLRDISGHILENDVFLICSDGLSDLVADDRIEELMAAEDSFATLMAEAKRNGGTDNISYILLKIK